MPEINPWLLLWLSSAEIRATVRPLPGKCAAWDREHETLCLKQSQVGNQSQALCKVLWSCKLRDASLLS